MGQSEERQRSPNKDSCASRDIVRNSRLTTCEAPNLVLAEIRLGNAASNDANKAENRTNQSRCRYRKCVRETVQLQEYGS